MIRLHHARLTRSMRIVWLLEELGLPHELVRVPFTPPAAPFAQRTPTGKFPTLEDGDVVIFESGAILEYLLERYGEGRLAPPPGTPQRGAFLQWVHFAEATLMPPLAQIAWWSVFKPEAERIPAVAEDARRMVSATLDVVECALEGRDYLLGSELSGADIMMGYSLQSAKWFGVLGERHPRTLAYFERLAARPAYRKALA